MDRIVAQRRSGSTTSRPRITTRWSPSSTTGDRVLYSHGQVMLGGEVIPDDRAAGSGVRFRGPQEAVNRAKHDSTELRVEQQIEKNVYVAPYVAVL
jgi:hypothetical protein